MAFLNMDLVPSMLLPGFSRVLVQGRTPFVRVVTSRARQGNENLAICTVSGLPPGEIPFVHLRDLILDLLVDAFGLVVKEVQRCPFGRGQAFVRLGRVSDRDGLVLHGDHHHHGLTFSFTNHNRGANARRVQFNRECWLMLVGYPVDYRNIDDISDAIRPFGRLLFWQRDNVLERIIIKARVTELVDVPHYIVISESDDHEGISLTAQCEIIKQNMLGELLQDEDFPPGGPGNDFIPPGIGFPNDQGGNLPALQPLQPLEVPDLNAPPEQPNQFLDQGNIPEVDLDALNDVEMPDLVPGVQAGDVQEEINLAPSDSLLQGSSSSAASADNGAAEEDGFMENNNGHEVVLALPVVPQPAPDLGMGVQNQIQIGQVIINQVIHDSADSINSRISGAKSHFSFPDFLLPANLTGGPAVLGSNLSGCLGPHNDFGPISQPKRSCPDVYRLWAKYFSPVGNPDHTIQMPTDWSPFFIKMLLSPIHFDWAKGFLASQTWDMLLSCADLTDCMVFAIPASCPVIDALICSGKNDDQSASVNNLSVPQDEVTPLVPLSNLLNTAPVGGTPIVDTLVRRSPRIKNVVGGFKHRSCMEKNFLACVAVPPQLSPSSLKIVAGEACKINFEGLSDQALSAKNKRKMAIGDKPAAKKTSAKIKGSDKILKKSDKEKGPANAVANE